MSCVCVRSRNTRAEELFGYSSEEAIARHVLEFLTEPRDHAAGYEILDRVAMGEYWTGLFPIKQKSGQMFTIIATDTPLYDDAGKFVASTSVSNDKEASGKMLRILAGREASLLANLFLILSSLYK